MYSISSTNSMSIKVIRMAKYMALFYFVLFGFVPLFSSAKKASSTKVKAVNLGGWLVTEGWMKPSLFDGISNKDLLVRIPFYAIKSFCLSCSCTRSFFFFFSLMRLYENYVGRNESRLQVCYCGQVSLRWIWRRNHYRCKPNGCWLVGRV